MKLLLEKKGNRGQKNPKNGISINKSSIYVNGTAFERLYKKDLSFFGNIGINEEGNISLYISYESNDLLYRFFIPKGNKKQARFSVNTKLQSKTLEPYVGIYDIKFISIASKNGIIEVVLQKQTKL